MGDLTFEIDAAASPYDELTSTWLMSDQCLGACFPMSSSGKSAVIAFNYLGTYTPDYYGGPDGFPFPEYNVCSGVGDKGPHSPPYYIEAWFYNPEDLLKVKRGDMDAAAPRPYAKMNLKPDLLTECVKVGSIAYDTGNQRIFVCETNAKMVGYDPLPVIHVYRIVDNAAVAVGPHEIKRPEVDLNCYPNPFSKNVDIILNSSTVPQFHSSTVNMEIEIFDLNGRLVANQVDCGTVELQHFGTSYTWSPTTSPNGLYLVRLTAGDRVHVKKVNLIR
jgi:hypothetical protein